MRCLGLDLGTHVSGAAVVEGEGQTFRLIQEMTLKSPKGRMSFRLLWLVEEMRSLMESYHPDVVALETPFYGIDVRALSSLAQIRGAVLVVIEQFKLPILDLAPQSVRKIVTGQGNATKEQVSLMISRLMGVSGFSSYDASDAAAVAYAGVLQKLYDRKVEENL